MKLTAKKIRELELPAGKTDHLFWDDDIPGLGLRVRAGGSRNWVFQYALGDKQRRLSLGTATPESFTKHKETARHPRASRPATCKGETRPGSGRR